MQEAIEYFNGDELAGAVWAEKYGLRDKSDKLIEKTPDDMHRRMAKELARVEKTKFKEPYSEDFIYSVFKDFGEIIPQGSPMSGIGSQQLVSLGNCYVLTPPSDSYGGIHFTDEQLTQISKRRGGVGIDISKLRPDGSPTTNSSRTSTGIVPFMERFSNSIREVGQRGRRGALMTTICVHHPQVLDFARAKLDKTKVTGSNISIRLSDEFLLAVQNDTEYEQRWPVESKTPVISKMVSACEVWKEIIHVAWLTAEPGLLFWGNILRESPADCYKLFGFETVSTNPCQNGNAKVLTKDGIRNLKDVEPGNEIWSKDGWTKVINQWSNGIKDVHAFRTTSGCFYGTKDHRLVSAGEKVMANDAESIDVLAGEMPEDTSFDIQTVMDGIVFGDGSVHLASNDLIYLNVGKDDRDYFTSEIAHLITCHRPGLSDVAYEIVTTIQPPELPHTYDRVIPDRFIQGDQKVRRSFLRGLFTANGGMSGNKVALKASSFKVIEDAQLILSSLGIRSYYTTNKAKMIRWPNGDYLSKQSYDLNIVADRKKFQKLIGFIQNYKNEKLDKIIAGMHTSPKYTKQPKLTYDVVSSEYISKEDVFDITVDNKSNTYWTQGCNVSNCGEIPLCVLDSCRLLLLNLFGFVNNPFTSLAQFDWERFADRCKIAQRLMDDIVDLELECIDKIIAKIKKDDEDEQVKARELNIWKAIREKCFSGRRTGTGPTALGDAMAAVGIKYGSDESIEFTEKVYKTMKLACYRSAVDMAKEIGPFPIWNAELEKDCPFLLRIKDEDPQLYKDMQKYGRRAIALNTTSPAGSTSLMAGPRPYFQTTSGIEPLFQEYFIRRKKLNHADKNVRVDFVDQSGDKWQEFKVYHPKLKLWMEVTGETDITKSPYYGCCAEQLDWKQRVKLQAAAQKHVDHSISATVNLPEDVSEESVAEIYETAWRSGCKGMTIYRKNCRTGVLVDDTSKKITKTDAPKRPKDLPCEIHHLTVNKEPFVAVVGIFSGDPYECFAFSNKKDLIAKSVKSGILRKESRGQYALLNEAGENLFIKNESLSSHLDGNEEAITRLCSTSLRHGVSIQFLVEQLGKVNGDLHIFAKCLARVLKKYISDGRKATGESCPNCQNEQLVYQEGCKRCPACQWSKCS